MTSRFRISAVAIVVVAIITAVTVGVALAHGGLGRVGGATGGLVATVADESGLAIEDVRAQLAEGESLAAVVASAGGDIDAVVDAALSGLDDRITALVDAGRLQADQGDAYAAAIEQRIRDILAWSFVGSRWSGRANHGKAGGLVALVAAETELSVEDIRTELAVGQSLAAVIEAAGGDAAAVTAAAMATFETKLSAAIEAGRVSADDAATLRERRGNRIEAALQAAGGRHGIGHGGFRFHRRGGHGFGLAPGTLTRPTAGSVAMIK